MTTFLLIRHAAHDAVDLRLVGRLPGFELGEFGRAQAERLAARLGAANLETVCSSPRTRAQQTAQAIGAQANLPVETVDDLDEVDFGRWSGRLFSQLNDDPSWEAWNRNRAAAATDGGERIIDIQKRICGVIERFGASAQRGAIALVSHAEVIKAAVCRYLGLSFEAVFRFEIAPASITTLELDASGAKLIALNERIA